jgi:hypothetical protein
VLNLKDIALMLCCIILVPFLYLILPLWLVAGLLGLLTLSILYFTGEPLLHRRWLMGAGALILLILDMGAALVLGTKHSGFLAINNVVLIIVVVGISNLWAQSGLKARDAALLGVGLSIYDVIATIQLPLMTNVLARLATLPFVPLVAWGSGKSTLSIGLGDLLLATVFPLVMRKAFGCRAGIAALLLSLAAIGSMLLLLSQGIFRIFPAMVVLGPLMALQYLFWRRRCGQERTMRLYLLQEPVSPSYDMETDHMGQERCR